MPYIFLVNETNRHICVQNCLFGVPATDRQYGTVKGEIDILGRDQRNNYIVTELKADILKKDIWTQLPDFL